MLTSKSRERFPPWDPQSQRYQLHKMLETFRERLPRDLALTQANLSAHLSAGPPTPYILLHTTLLLCGIVLHRDYMPFLPLRCTKPQGPLDPPLFPADKYQTPPDWWEESAKDLFRSARDLINLLQTCKEWNVLVVTPLVGFAVYTAAFVGKDCDFPRIPIMLLIFNRCLQQPFLVDGSGWLLVQETWIRRPTRS
jgi:hypothetical protein